MSLILLSTLFSSPFIEERLYFEGRKIVFLELDGSRPLLSRSGCILEFIDRMHDLENVLVPFYRGAVVFRIYKDRKSGG